MIKVGILSLQGAIESHEEALSKAAKELNQEIEITRVILPEELQEVHGIVIPGGESTAMNIIGMKSGILQAVRKRLQDGLPAFGTCAGAILLSKSVKRTYESQEMEGIFPYLDIEIIRNGYGRQKDSFSTNLHIKGVNQDVPGIFIRAPVISKTSSQVEVLASVAENPVLVKERNIFASTFHPELSESSEIHKLFLQLVISQVD